MSAPIPPCRCWQVCETRWPPTQAHHFAIAATFSAESPLSILNDLSLIYLDRLQMPLPQASLWPALPEVIKARAPEAAPAPDAKGLVDVRCGGALRFDFTTYTLSLNDQVTLTHAGALT